MRKADPDTNDGRTLRLCREFRSLCRNLNWTGLTFIGRFVSEREFSETPPVDGVSSAASHHHRGCKHGCGAGLRRVFTSGRAVAFSGRYWMQMCVARRHPPAADASAESASRHSPAARPPQSVASRLSRLRKLVRRSLAARPAISQLTPVRLACLAVFHD